MKELPHAMMDRSAAQTEDEPAPAECGDGYSAWLRHLVGVFLRLQSPTFVPRAIKDRW